MAIIKLGPNKSANIASVRGSFDYVYKRGDKALLLPIDLYNFFITNGVSTVTDLAVFIQNHPRMMCAILGWNFKELKHAYLSLMGDIKENLPEAVSRRPLTEVE